MKVCWNAHPSHLIWATVEREFELMIMVGEKRGKSGEIFGFDKVGKLYAAEKQKTMNSLYVLCPSGAFLIRISKQKVFTPWGLRSPGLKISLGKAPLKVSRSTG